MIPDGAQWYGIAIGTYEHPYATFAIAVKDGVVVEAPPIGRSSRMRLVGMRVEDAIRALDERARKHGGMMVRPLPQA